MIELKQMFVSSKATDDIQSIMDGLTIYGNISLLAIGLIGNTLNILVFATLRLFHKNPSAFCVLIESMANLGQMLTSSVTHILSFGFGISASTNSLFWCKTKNVAQQCFNLLFMGSICFAALDQFLSTHPRYYSRQINSFKLIKRLLFVLIVLTLLHSIPFLVFFEIIPRQGCIVKSPLLMTYYSFFYYAALVGLLPILITITLGSIAVDETG